MKFAEFIVEKIFKPRLATKCSLIVYDAPRRFREVCLAMKSEKIVVIDASDESLDARFAALNALGELSRPQTRREGLLVYVPTRKPASETQKEFDPFAVYAESGAVFPDGASDDYLQLCLQFKPAHEKEIRRLFAQSDAPDFAAVDAIGGGVNFPLLNSLLGAESAREILRSLLAPNAAQSAKLNENEIWNAEAKELFKTALGLTLKTRSKNFSAISRELWRFVLFSEFVFDLPNGLPDALRSVPHAAPEAENLINELCDYLRDNQKTADVYRRKADEIEIELKLAETCREVENLGTRETFYFEGRTFLENAIGGVLGDNSIAVREILHRRADSVWRVRGDNQPVWTMLAAALDLIENCARLEQQFNALPATQTALIDFYLADLHRADRLHREFEESVADVFGLDGRLKTVVKVARAKYARLIEKTQAAFVRFLESEGWTPAGRLANSDVYDLFVAPHLKERGRKIAFLQIDALRYELGASLAELLAETGETALHAAFANLPSVTRVGMASLLPGAKNDLFLELNDKDMIPKLGDAAVVTVKERMRVFDKKLGDRFAEMTLTDFVGKKPKISPNVELLVLRSVEIDSQLENNPETTLSVIPNNLKFIRAALHGLRSLGFHEAVIAADHGFFLNTHAAAGDVCPKPAGNWHTAHDRMLLGEGDGDAHNAVIAREKLGIRGNFAKCAVPRSLAPYADGYKYFHGGASLAETIVPVLCVQLTAAEPAQKKQIKVELSYKAKRITTRLPVLELALFTDDLFAEETEILLEAVDENGSTVGEPSAGAAVNSATKTILLKPGETRQIAVRMSLEFEGKFIVKALNPTTLATYATLNLHTDYPV